MQSGGLPDVLEEEEPIEEVRIQEEELIMKTFDNLVKDCDVTKDNVNKCDVIKTTECRGESEELIVNPKLVSPAAKKWKKITNVWRVGKFVNLFFNGKEKKLYFNSF